MYTVIGNGADQHSDRHHDGHNDGHSDLHDLDVLVDGHPTCACGQELDTCRRAHCPRCGHRLRELVGAGRRAG